MEGCGQLAGGCAFESGGGRSVPRAFDAPAGCQVIIEAPGGGGYGAKNDRDPDAHAADAKDHYVS